MSAGLRWGGEVGQMNSKEALAAGVRAILPMLPGVAPFGVLAGLAAVEAGLSPLAALASSVFIFAGVAQMATMQLIGSGALPLVIVMTAVVINLRYLMYSAALAPYFSHLSVQWKWWLAYLMTDQSFAVTVAHAHGSSERAHLRWFYLSGAILLWSVWQLSTAVGIFVGAKVPESWSLGFAIPLIFLGLLIPLLRDRPTVVAALVGGAVALAARELPLNLGLLAGAAAGIGAGMLADRFGQPPAAAAPPKDPT
jgi:4-azaleucine resistance transporter AzlC